MTNFNQFDLTNYYDIETNKFRYRRKDDLASELKNEENEIVKKINNLLNKQQNKLFSDISKVKIKLIPKAIKKSNYYISYEKAVQPILNNSDNYPKGFIADLRRIVETYNEHESEIDLEEEINKLIDKHRNDITDTEAANLRKWAAGRVKVGEFIEKGEGTIILYLNPISKSTDYNNYIFEVFAHELFHAYHWLATNKCFSCSWKYNSFQKSTVKEGLASFLEYRYISNHSNELSRRLENRLSQIDMKHYPYSAYKYIDDDFFRKLFALSLEDLGDAYNLLVYKKMDDSINDSCYSSSIRKQGILFQLD